MSIPVVVDLANPDVDDAPTTLQALVDILRTLITAEITATFTPYVRGEDTPDVDDQDKVWHRTDSVGRPAGTYIYFNGRWVREAPPPGALVSFFVGDPTLYFDGTGLGLSGAGAVALDFYGWALMNGNNGTDNLSNRFIIAGQMDNVDITGYLAGTGWRTNIRGFAEHEGGDSTITLDEDTTYSPAVPELIVGTYSATGNTQDGDLYGSLGDPGNPQHVLIDAVDGNPTPDAISIVPPFYALALLQWIGYPVS